MNITLNIEAGSAAELQEAISGLAGIVGGAVSVPTTAPAKTEKSKRSNQATTKPDPDKQPEAEPEKEPETTEDDTEETEIPTVVDLRAAAQEKGKTPEGKKAIKALLDQFESKSISDVPEEQRSTFLAALEALEAL